MWGMERKRGETVAEEEPQHWPAERMEKEGHADYMLPSDLEALDVSLLLDIAQLCDVQEFSPDECIPCLAGVMVLERRRVALAQEAKEALKRPSGAPFPDDSSELDVTGEELELDPNIPPGTVAYLPTEDKPVVERFAEQVKTLAGMVEELLEGPPIPPPNVSLEELALLTIASRRWVQITEAQGVELAPKQHELLERTKVLLHRLDHG